MLLSTVGPLGAPHVGGRRWGGPC